MTFPNAYSGVKKIFTSQILVLIGAILIGVAAVMGGATAVSTTNGTMNIDVAVGTTAGAAGVALVGSVLIIVGYIINLVGLHQAGKDEKRYFKPAFIIAIVTLILAIVAGLFSDNASLQSVVSLISRIAEMFVIIFTIAGIGELANKLNRPQIASFGNKVLILILVAQILAVIANMIGSGNAAAGMSIAGSILAIVSYIAFLVYLSRGKNMLQSA